MSKKYKDVSIFSLEGRFLGFETDGYKLKWLRLATTEGECRIKLSKEARASVGGVLMPGDWLQILGEKTVKEAEVKLKAIRILVLSPNSAPTPPVSAPVASASCPKATILMCQKSDCMKRGGKALCKALQAELSDRNLDQHVTLRPTGCMKNCKAGPNLIVMPGKARYSHVSPEDIPALLQQHFTQAEVAPVSI